MLVLVLVRQGRRELLQRLAVLPLVLVLVLPRAPPRPCWRLSPQTECKLVVIVSVVVESGGTSGHCSYMAVLRATFYLPKSFVVSA